MRRIGTLATLLTAVALVMAPALAANKSFVANMTAEQEVPEPGPEGGKGTAEVQVDDETGMLCYKLTHEGIPQPNAGHIHEAPAGQAGPVSVDFDLPNNGDQACLAVDPAELRHIAEDPAGHYVNIHTEEHPKGAIRGQLEEAEPTGY